MTEVGRAFLRNLIHYILTIPICQEVFENSLKIFLNLSALSFGELFYFITRKWDCQALFAIFSELFSGKKRPHYILRTSSADGTIRTPRQVFTDTKNSLAIPCRYAIMYSEVLFPCENKD